MAFIPVPNTAMVEVIFSTPGGVAENTLYFEKPEPWTAAALLNLTGGVLAWWINNLAAITSEDIALTSVKATSLESDTAPSIENAPSSPLAGTFVSEAVPSNATITTTFLTELRGRSFRGRNYFVGLSNGQVTLDKVLTTFRSSLNTAYEDLRLNLPSPATAWVVVSRFSDGLPRAIGVTTPITGVKGDLNIDSQRRRLIGRGS